MVSESESVVVVVDVVSELVVASDDEPADDSSVLNDEVELASSADSRLVELLLTERLHVDYVSFSLVSGESLLICPVTVTVTGHCHGVFILATSSKGK